VINSADFIDATKTALIVNSLSLMSVDSSSTINWQT